VTGKEIRTRIGTVAATQPRLMRLSAAQGLSLA
jgi:hypothetical protein